MNVNWYCRHASTSACASASAILTSDPHFDSRQDAFFPTLTVNARVATPSSPSPPRNDLTPPGVVVLSSQPVLAATPPCQLCLTMPLVVVGAYSVSDYCVCQLALCYFFCLALLHGNRIIRFVVLNLV
ncbi:hypothetical protein E2542_SST25963 [Spatholobus suberectus]|nr:hypothetical protein E2542_SST25963 [Spatholobus suberectus]